jgi:NDP-sugar pyrophosphorylase family protein
MRPYTNVLPKPLIPLGSESIIERVLRNVAGAGITDVTVSLGYLGHLVEAVLGDGSSLGLSVRYTREPEPLGTAGALSLLPFELEDDDLVLVINGDTLTDLDLAELLEWFEGTGAAAAMVCVERDVLIDYGVVDVGPDGSLRGIREKPRVRNTLSTGINVIRGRAVKSIGPGRLDMPDFLVGLATAGEPVLCRTVDNLWMDLGRPEDLAAANDLVEKGII